MTEKEIIEGNKTIAEFMGAKCHKGIGDLKSYTYAKFPDKSDKCGITLRIDLLEYHKKWDNWLMPVIEKIERRLKWAYSVKIEHEVYNIGRYTCEIYDSGYATKIEYSGRNKIEIVWKSVVYFIKVYNFNNK